MNINFSNRLRFKMFIGRNLVAVCVGLECLPYGLSECRFNEGTEYEGEGEDGMMGGNIRGKGGWRGKPSRNSCEPCLDGV